MEIIPAIDIIDGKCVRLTRGEYADKTIYHADPLEIAKEFEKNGLRRLHLVDLDGARKGEVENWKVLESICSNTSMEVDFSGGISSMAILQKVFDSGAGFATIGSMAVTNEADCLAWIRHFGPQKFIIGADVKDGLVMTRGWKEKSGYGVFDLLKKYTGYGITLFMCTDINKDGMLQGPAVELYRSILGTYPWIKLIASGGVSSKQDLIDLKNTGVYGTIIGKAIYEKRIPLEDLKQFG